MSQRQTSMSRSAAGGNIQAPAAGLLQSQKPRQLSQLQAQLAQLTANMADMENLLQITAAQAESMRGLAGYAGAM